MSAALRRGLFDFPFFFLTQAFVAEGDWYYTQREDRLGPVSFAELKEVARSGGIDPRYDVVWTRGMTEWVLAGEMEGVFSKRAAPTLKAKEDVPVAKPRVRQVTRWSSGSTGASRSAFFAGMFILPVLLGWGITMGTPYLTPYLDQNGIEKNLPTALLLLAPIPAIFVMFGRLKNLGMSGWWFLGFFIPLLNVWLFYRCIACPADYARAKKLDGPGWLMTALFGFLILLGIALPVAAYMNGDRFPKAKEWLEQAKTGKFSIPWEMKNGTQPASGPVKK